MKSQDRTDALSLTGWRRVLRGTGARLAFSFIVTFMAVLLLIELISIYGLPGTSFSGRQGQQHAEAIASLDLIADLKKEQLVRWLEERRDDAVVFSANTLITASVSGLSEKVERLAMSNRVALREMLESQPDAGDLTGYLKSIQAAYGAEYARIDILDTATGVVLVSTDRDALGDDVSGRAFFIEAAQSRRPLVGRVAADPQSGSSVFHVTSPIASTGIGDTGEMAATAVLALTVNTDDILGPILHTGEGLGGTGEALLVNSGGWTLTSLKHPLPDGSRPLPLTFRITAEPAVRAGRGEEGMIEALDYRGEPVLAAYRHIGVTPDQGWGLVVKRDRADGELRKLPVIMVTTTDDPREIDRCHALGCSVYVTKPVDYQQFSNAIRRLGLFLTVVQVPVIDGTA